MNAAASFALRSREFALASLVTSYPDEEMCEVLQTVGVTAATHSMLKPLLEGLSEPNGLDNLRSMYIDLFDRGGGRASLYETEYGRMRGMAKGNDLADIAGFYQAFGLTLDADNVHEMLDHIAVELEFYSYMLRKEEALQALGDDEGVAIVADGRKKFVVEHLGRLSRAITQRKEVQGHAVYGPIFAWGWDLVAQECNALGCEPPLIDYFGDDELKREMECGAVRLPVLR